MKYQILSLMLFSHFICSAQLYSNSKKIAELGSWKYPITIMQSPDEKEITLYFQNREYSAIEDIKHIDFANKDSFAIFIQNMKSTPLDHTFQHSSYLISCQKGMLGVLYLWIYDGKSTGYFWYKQKNTSDFEKVLPKLH